MITTAPNDLILTFLRDRNSFRHAGIAVFGNSLRQYYRGDVVAVSGTEPLESDWDPLRRHSIHVQPYPDLGNSLYQSWRWLAYWTFLCSSPPGRRIMILDSFDVMVQGHPFAVLDGEVPASNDPFAVLDQIAAPRTLILGAEGPRYRDCEWNTQDMLRLQKACGPSGPSNFMDWPVVNASIVAGPAELVRDWCMRIATFLLGIESSGATDMAVTGMLYHQFIQQDNRLMPVNLMTPKDPLVITGNWVRSGQSGVPLTWNERTCQIAGPAGVYTLFHQWDRTNYAADILAKWGNWSQPDYGPRVITTYNLEAFNQTKDKIRANVSKPRK